MPDKITASIKIRTTPDEKIQWQEKAIYSGVPLSNLVRQAISQTNTRTAAHRFHGLTPTNPPPKL